MQAADPSKRKRQKSAEERDEGLSLGFRAREFRIPAASGEKAQ